MKRPATTDITLKFGPQPGYPLHDGVHEGTDFAFTPDSKVYAPFAGRVIVRPNNGDDGNGVYMSQGDYLVGMCHLSKFLVTDGETVAEGQPLGVMGNTGFAEGVHLHFAVKKAGRVIDPESVIDKEKTMGELTEAQVKRVYHSLFQREASDDELKTWVGKDSLDLLFPYIVDRADVLGQTIADLRGATDPRILMLAQAIKGVVQK